MNKLAGRVAGMLTLDIDTGVASEEKVQIHGKTGIVVGRFDANGTYEGKPFESTERCTSVWIVRDELAAAGGTGHPPSKMRAVVRPVHAALRPPCPGRPS